MILPNEAMVVSVVAVDNMIYPTYNLDTNTTNIIDTEFDDEPIISFSSNSIEDSFESFLILLQAFINQYDIGFADGVDFMDENLEETQ